MTQESTSLRFEFSCPLVSGLHARPASQLAEVANRFAAESTVTNLRNGLAANGRSVLGLIAADIRQGDRCAVQVDGLDADRAYAALQRFAEATLPHCDVPLARIAESARDGSVPRPLQTANVACIFGESVSRGIGTGRVVVLGRLAPPDKSQFQAASDPRQELERVNNAIAKVSHRIREKLKSPATSIGSAMLQADLAMAGDVLLIEKISEAVWLGKSAAQAVVEAGEFFSALFGHSENEYTRQRSADIEEICLQLLEEVCETTLTNTVALREPSVLVAERLVPQQILELDRRWLKALVLEHSGATSHAAILARSLGIPTLAGVRAARQVLAAGREVVVDANRGFVVPEFSRVVKQFYDREQSTLEKRKRARSNSTSKSVHTADGRRIEVAANASSGEEVALAFENGAEGIGLFRTEMLFLGRELAPSEDEQCAIYSEAARMACGRPVIIRTFDVGGDKSVPYLNLSHEENPFLGCRGVRLYDKHRDVLQAQLRAILRASIAGPIQIMAPMISSVEEIVQFKAAVAQAKQDLGRKGISFHPDIKIGMMIEVPSVAFIVDHLCKHVDFFSIGTNDLSQYFFAADRTNAAVSSLFPDHHPAFLRFLEQLVDSIHRAGMWVGMCGEMAGDIRNLPLLIALGLDEISVPAAQVDDLKRRLTTLDTSDCAKLLASATACATSPEVEQLLAAQRLQPRPRSLLSNDLVLLESTSQTKEEVIQEMVDAFYVSGRTEDRHPLEEALWAREAMGSTGLGYGFAIPHCKTDAVAANSICVLRLKDPINWGPDHGERVSMVVLLALRDSEVVNTHMQVFSSLARKLINEDFRQHLLRIKTAGEVTSYLANELGLSLQPEDER